MEVPEPEEMVVEDVREIVGRDAWDVFTVLPSPYPAGDIRSAPMNPSLVLEFGESNHKAFPERKKDSYDQLEALLVSVVGDPAELLPCPAKDASSLVSGASGTPM